MVVLEPVPSTDIESKRSTTSTTVTSGREDRSSSDQPNVAGVDSKNGGKAAGEGYASDGFETASETEVCDDETVSYDDNDSNDAVKQQEQQPVEVSVVSKDQSYEDTLNDEELLVQMNEAKVEGNKLFGDGLYDEALLKYDYAIQLAPQTSSSAEIRSICHNNRATCFFKLGKYEDSVKECTKALELNPTYMKPLVRKAEAHEKLENYDESLSDLKKILELDPCYMVNLYVKYIYLVLREMEWKQLIYGNPFLLVIINFQTGCCMNFCIIHFTGHFHFHFHFHPNLRQFFYI